MFYEGTDKKIEWTGRMEQNEGRPFLAVEKVYLALGTGGIVPENWQGKRVRLTVELLEEAGN
jgi:hypothetical protein